MIILENYRSSSVPFILETSEGIGQNSVEMRLFLSGWEGVFCRFSDCIIRKGSAILQILFL